MIKLRKMIHVIITIANHTIQKTMFSKSFSFVGASKSKSPREIRRTVQMLAKR
jgi:hypothetical protein